MKIHKLRLPAVALALAVGLSMAPAAAFAQATPPGASSTSCTATTGSVAQVPDPAVSASGYPDEGFDYTPPTAAADPKPENPVSKACEGGKIQIMVGNKQEFGNRIGGLVEVRVLLLVDNGVTVDLGTLQRGILKFDGTDRFHPALDNPVTITTQQKNGKTLYTIDLRLQSFVPKPNIPFNIDLRYSTSVVTATGKPDWKVLTTPDFQVTTSNTLDNGDQLKEGNMQPAAVATPWPIKTLLYTGAGLVLLWPLVSLLIWLNRKRPGRKVPANEVAWKTLARVFEEGNTGGYKERHYRYLVDALKGYLGAGTLTREEISAKLEGDPRHDTVIGALKKCDLALYAAKHSGLDSDLLSAAEVAELVAQIKEIVPQPE